MNIVLGPYHPHLEDALAGEMRAERARDPLSPILVVVPSDALRRRIKTLLAREHGLPLLNFRVHTFFQLTLILSQEVRGSSGFPLRDDTFMEEALRHAVAARGRSLSFAAMMESDGICAALWQTLRDLKDGLVDPEVALEALDEGHFEQSDEAGLRELLTLYSEVRTRFTEWGAKDHADLDLQVEPFVDTSRYLAQFPRIYYYGFYDLTQIQLELFRSVARRYRVTLFFPLVTGHPGWSFADRFYENHLHGLVGTDAVVDLTRGGESPVTGLGRNLFADPAAAAPAVSPRCTIVSCSGARDEVLFAAKKTLELVDNDGLRFEQIGVVARTLDTYLPWLEEIFPEHGIPFNTSAREPLLLFNLVKALLLLIDLPVRGFMRTPVIDLLTSPYFKLPRTTSGIEPRPDIWDVVTRALRITRGLSEWNRLERYLETGLTLRLSSEEDGKPLEVPPEQLASLLSTVRTLHERLSSLPAEGKWSDLSDRWRDIINEFIDCKRGAGEAPAAIEQAIDEIFNGLAALEIVSPQTSLSYFTESLHKELARASIPVSDENIPGVHFIDAMSARGMPFRALLLLGMNEGVFPRTIREDPFLRDRSRRVLEAVLGFKISEKLGAYDEEKLLFSLLVGSASERLYCLYQRSDSAGRALAPSWYLGELQRRAGTGNASSGTVAIPRGILGKAAAAPFDEVSWLPPGELAVRLALSAEDPSPLLPLTGTLAEAFTRGVATIRCLEDSEDPGPFDGLTGPLPEYWDRITTRGISPTNLEAYGRCPFQYFARHTLRLERLERPEAITAVEPVEIGKICHDILHRFYEEAGLEVRTMEPGDRESLFDRVAARVAADYEAESPTGYPVEWAVVREALVNLLREAIRVDLKELERSNFRPVAFEMELGAQLGKEWPDDLQGLPIHGRLDRMDANEVDGRVRVVDYKFKPGRRPNARDKDLVLAAVRGMQLQPPLYSLLAAGGAGTRPTRPDVSTEAAFYFLAPRWDEGPLVARSFSDQVWSEPAGAAIRQAITQLLRGIRQGEFFILPGDYCRFCEVSEICRKTHPLSRARAERHSGAEAMTRMRKKT